MNLSINERMVDSTHTWAHEITREALHLKSILMYEILYSNRIYKHGVLLKIVVCLHNHRQFSESPIVLQGFDKGFDKVWQLHVYRHIRGEIHSYAPHSV